MPTLQNEEVDYPTENATFNHHQPFIGSSREDHLAVWNEYNQAHKTNPSSHQQVSAPTSVNNYAISDLEFMPSQQPPSSSSSSFPDTVTQAYIPTFAITPPVVSTTTNTQGVLLPSRDEEVCLLLFILGVFVHIVMLFVFLKFIRSPSERCRTLAKYAGFVVAFYALLYSCLFCTFFLLFSLPSVFRY